MRKKLLTRSGLESVLAAEGVRIDVDDTFQVFALIWEKFFCEQCGREDLYRHPTEKFKKSQWIPEAAKKSKADGWFVPAWTSHAGMELVAYCPKCKQEQRSTA